MQIRIGYELLTMHFAWAVPVRLLHLSIAVRTPASDHVVDRFVCEV